ncbi:MAG: TetR family transcriptional regulator [Balneolaceae bacterium]|nr:TetR family transcriptional regulator [Balneolaceae bacterium]
MGHYAKSEKTRQRIIEAAAELFNRQGYAGTSLSDIIGATGLTKGCIYGHFDSKKEIELAAFNHNRKLIFRDIQARLRSAEGAREKLMEFVEGLRRNVGKAELAGGCPLLNSSVEIDDRDGVLHDRVVASVDRWHRLLEKIIREGMDSGEFSDQADPREMASLLISVYEGGMMLMKARKSQRHITYAFSHMKRLIDDLKPH